MDELLKQIEALSLKESKTLMMKLVKLQEECGELAQKALIYEKAPGTAYRCGDPETLKEDIKEEAVDVLLVLLSIFISEGGSLLDLTRLLKKKLKKWEATQN